MKICTYRYILNIDRESNKEMAERWAVKTMEVTSNALL